MATKMTREEAIKIVQSATVWTDEERDALAMLIPELAESEDEKIRKKMIEHFKSKTKDTWCNMPVKSILAWLEKQKDLDKMIVVSPEVWDNAITDAYENGKRDSEKQKEQKPAEWSEEDDRNIQNLESIVYYAKNLPDETRIELSDFLKSLRPQPKKGYSDEDEDRISDVLWCIEQSRKVAKNENDMGTCWSAERFVKSLRFDTYKNCNSHWKPSEEDIKMLEHIIGQYEIGNKNSKVMGYLPRIEELDFLKKVLAKWKN